MKWPLLIIVASLLFNKLYSQTTNTKAANFYEIWQSSDSNKTNFTYDSSFKLKIHLKSPEKIAYVLLYEWNGKRKLSDYFNPDASNEVKFKNFFSRYPYPKFMYPTVDSSLLTVQFNNLYNADKITDGLNIGINDFDSSCDTNNSCYLSIDHVRPAGALKPGRKYALIVFHDINTSIFNPDKILKYNSNDRDSVNTFKNTKEILNKLYIGYRYFRTAMGDTASFIYKSIDTAYQNLYDPSNNNIPIFLKNKKPFQYPFDHLVQDFDTTYPQINGFLVIKNFIPVKDSINTKIDSTSRSGYFTKNDVINFKKDIKEVYDYYRSVSNCSIKKTCPACNTDSTYESKLLLTLWSLDSADWVKINDGTMAIVIKNSNVPGAKTSDDITPAQKQQNITASVQLIKTARDFLTKLQFEKASVNCGTCTNSCCKLCTLDDKDIADLDTLYLENHSKALGLTKKSLANLDLAFQKCTNDFLSKYRYLATQTDVYDANSFIMDFQTRTAVHITPVFGYCYYGFGSVFQANMQGFSPYVGFQINFEALNQNVPFRLINNKHFWQRLVFTTGWTLASVAKAGKRSDFFGNSSSLFTALGLKVSHVFTFNCGALWFRAYNPNPLITDKTIACVPSISLSINFTASQLLGDFVKLIPSL